MGEGKEISVPGNDALITESACGLRNKSTRQSDRTYGTISSSQCGTHISLILPWVCTVEIMTPQEAYGRGECDSGLLQGPLSSLRESRSTSALSEYHQAATRQTDRHLHPDLHPGFVPSTLQELE